jgi:hypothetical protein
MPVCVQKSYLMRLNKAVRYPIDVSALPQGWLFSALEPGPKRVPANSELFGRNRGAACHMNPKEERHV